MEDTAQEAGLLEKFIKKLDSIHDISQEDREQAIKNFLSATEKSSQKWVEEQALLAERHIKQNNNRNFSEKKN